MSRATRLYLVLLLIGAAYFVFILVEKNRAIHAENKCAMTFMYRRIYLTPIPVPGYTEKRYSLLQYSEAFSFPQDYIGGPDDIPVIFVPGSGGSGAQVRSLASVMQNKTEMRRASFRMHFYALDFKEEMSFLSGNTLIRQRDFLMKSINVLRKRYFQTADKMVLFGHSFGGVVIRSLPLHPDFKPNMMNFVLTSAAPLLHFPVVLDFPMADLYTQIEELWEVYKEMKLEHVKYLSFSGGEKDFLVSDRMVSADNTIHLPSWSIPGVETPADHLCILWCNQLVRYSSRILFQYGEEAGLTANPHLTSKIISGFEAQETERINSLRKIVSHFNVSNFQITSPGTLGLDNAPANSAFQLELPISQVYKIYIQCTDSRGDSCSEKLKATILYSNGWTSFGDDSRLHGIRVKSVLLRPRTDSRSAYLILQEVQGHVDYAVTVEADYMASWYMLAISYGFDILSSVYFSIFSAIPLLESARIAPKSLATILLTAAFLGVALLIFHPYVFALGITGILLLIGEYAPFLSLIFQKLNNRYFCLLLACLHPDLAIISTLLRDNKMRSSPIFQILLVLSVAAIVPSLFEGAKPRLVLPLHFYYLIKEINIFNPSWIYLYREFAESQRILHTENVWNLISAMVASYNMIFLLLSSQIFEQVPLSVFPLFLTHVLLLTRFSPRLATWWRRIFP